MLHLRSFFAARHAHTRMPVWVSVVGSVLLFGMLWTAIALGGLRVFIPHVFSLFGNPFSSRSYLIIFQNNTELRPTGGFISAYGVLDIRYGFLPSLQISDVYGAIDDHPYVAPPYPMEELLKNEWYQGYTFRDANYNPDFLASANDLVTFYKKTNPEAVFDGVFAIDFTVIERLTYVLGGVKSGDVTFTGDRLFEMLEESVANVDRHSVDALKNRKNVLRDFAKALMRDVFLSPLRWRQISDTVMQGLTEKHILLAFSSPQMRRFATAHNWDGSFLSTDSKGARDFLSIVEANLGGMKSNRYITRDIVYTVDFTSSAVTPSATVSITFSHAGTDNEPLSGPYTGYVRTYVPSGSSQIPSLHMESLGDRVGWGEILRLEPGETKTLTYTYTLPSGFLSDDFYSLFVRKQPGTLSDHLRVIVLLPQGDSLQSDVFTSLESTALYDGFLTKDLFLSFVRIPDDFGPRVSFHEITDLNRIELHFNEKINGDLASDPLNYAITDVDFKDESTHDTVFIVDIEHFDKTVVLHTKGMTRQEGEFYSVTVSDVRDTHGNFIDPNPRVVTVVQRLE